MNISKNVLLISLSFKRGIFQLLHNLTNKSRFFIGFFIVSFFYSPFLFSNTDKDNSNLKAPQAENQSSSSPSLAGNMEKKGACPSLPEIASAMVYQSVQAPQIEPRDEQEFEGDPSHPVFKSYDLVANKPAVVLLSLKPPENIKEDEEYIISLRVKDKEPLTEAVTREIEEEKAKNEKITAKCSLFFDTIKFSTKNFDVRFSERKCRLKSRHFKRIIEQVKRGKEYIERRTEEDIHNLNIFVEIPTRYEGDLRSITKDLSVFISSQEDESCVSNKKGFSIDIRKTNPLRLDFINLSYDETQGKACKENNIEVSDYNIIHQFANSKEVNEYLPMMYPIGEGQVSSSAVTSHPDFVYGSCDDKDHPHVKTTAGIVSDILSAQFISSWHYINNNALLLDLFRSEGKSPIPLTEKGFSALNSKLIVIVSEEYMKFHKRPRSSGFILRPAIEDDERIGSWNVAFVREDALEDDLAKGKGKAQGVVLHEVAHTLGQIKEYYEKEDKNGNSLPPDQQSRCRKFSKDQEIFCYDYKIFGGLMASFKNRAWRFVNDKTPFMNNAQTKVSNLGIDRETFQKLFQTLHHENLDPTSSEEQGDLIQNFQKRAGVVFLSGLYDKKAGLFYDGFSIVHEQAFPSFARAKGSLEVLLAKRIITETSLGYEILSRAYPLTELKMEFLFIEGGGESLDLEVVPITVGLSIPDLYLKNEELRDDLRLIVREIFHSSEPEGDKSLVQNISFEEGAREEFSERIIYESKIDWDIKLKELLLKRAK